MNGHKIWTDLGVLLKASFAEFMRTGWTTFIAGMHQAMPEITTLWIIACALMMMFTGDVGKWGGRAAAGFFAGACFLIMTK